MRDLVTKYFAAIERGDETALRTILHPDIVQREMPNKLNPQGGTSDFTRMLERLQKGKQMLERETYVLRSIICEGSRAALEVEWSGVLRNGTSMNAFFAIFLETREGKIVSQTNYDCFESV